MKNAALRILFVGNRGVIEFNEGTIPVTPIIALVASLAAFVFWATVIGAVKLVWGVL